MKKLVFKLVLVGLLSAVVLALLLFAPLQLVLLYYVHLDNGVWWGYLLGGTGAALVLIGGVRLLFRP